MNILCIVSAIFCISIINSQDKSIQKALKRPKPAELLFTYSHALNTVDYERNIGFSLLEQASQEKDKKQKNIHLNNAAECFKPGTYGLTFFQYNTEQKQFIRNLFIDPVSVDNYAYTHYLKILDLDDMTEKTINSFANPLRFLKNGLCLGHFSLDTTINDLDNMSLNVFAKTGSTQLIDYLLNTPLLFNEDVLLKAVWKGAKRWEPKIFAINTQELANNSLFMLFNQETFNSPLFKADFLTTCIEKKFNPFTMEHDDQAYDHLKEITKMEIAQSFDTNNEIDLQIAQNISDRLTLHPLQEALESSNYPAITRFMEPYFIKTNFLKALYTNKLLTPMLKKYFSQNNEYLNQFDASLGNLSSTIDPILRSFVYLCGPQRNHRKSLELLAKCPTPLGLMRALEETCITKKWDNLAIILPALIKHLEYYSFNDFNTSLDQFSKCINEELLQKTNPLLIHQFLAYYYPLLIQKAIKDNALPIHELTPYLELAREHTVAWLGDTYKEETDDRKHVLKTLLNDVTLQIAMLDQSPKLLEQQSKLLLKTIIENPSHATALSAHLNDLFNTLYAYDKAAFNRYLITMAEKELKGPWLGLLSIIAFLWRMEEEFPKPSKQHFVLQHFLSQLSNLSKAEYHELNDDILLEVLDKTYEKYADRELLVTMANILRGQNCELYMSTFIGKLKEQSTVEIRDNLDFLEKMGVIQNLQESPVLAERLMLAEMESVCCENHIPDVRYGETYKEQQLKSIQLLETYCKEIKDQTPAEEDWKFIEGPRMILEKIAARERLIWTIEFAPEEAMDTVIALLNAKGTSLQSAVDCDRHIFDVFNRLMQNNQHAIESFIEKLKEKVQVDAQYSLASAYAHLMLRPNDIVFQKTLELLDKKFNFTLAERLIISLNIRMVGTTEYWTQFSQIIEKNLNAWTAAFNDYTKDEKEFLLEFLNRINRHCACPLTELTLYKLRTLYESTLSDKDKETESTKESDTDTLLRSLPQVETSLEALEKRLYLFHNSYIMNRGKLEKFPFIYKTLDQYATTNYLTEIKKFAKTETKDFCDLLHAKIIFLISGLNYTKLMPLNTPYESLIAQIKFSKALMEFKLKSKQVSEEIKKEFRVLLPGFEHLTCIAEINYKPEEFTKKLIDKLTVYTQDPTILSIDCHLKDMMREAFRAGALHEFADRFENRSLSEDEKMLACYVNQTIAAYEIESNKLLYIKRVEKFAQSMTKENELIVAMLISLYNGSIYRSFVDAEKAYEKQQEFEEILYKKYKPLFVDDSKWLPLAALLESSVKKGNSNISLLMARLFYEQGLYEDAKIYASIVVDIEKKLESKKKVGQQKYCFDKAQEYLNLIEKNNKQKKKNVRKNKK
jgi:FMN phosphatase YigB (HAD superfamily)